MNLTIKSRFTSLARKYRRHARKWIVMNANAVFFHPFLSNAFPEYILEQSPPNMYIPDTSPAIAALVPRELAYSVTVDISAYITRAVKRRAVKIRMNDFVNILSSAFIV